MNERKPIDGGRSERGNGPVRQRGRRGVTVCSRGEDGERTDGRMKSERIADRIQAAEGRGRDQRVNGNGSAEGRHLGGKGYGSGRM